MDPFFKDTIYPYILGWTIVTQREREIVNYELKLVITESARADLWRLSYDPMSKITTHACFTSTLYKYI